MKKEEDIAANLKRNNFEVRIFLEKKTDVIYIQKTLLYLYKEERPNRLHFEFSIPKKSVHDP